MINKKYIILIGISLSLFFINLVSSQSIIGVSPGELYYKDVLRGGYAEKSVLVIANSEEPVDIEIEGLGAMKSWFNYTKKFTLDDGKNFQLVISVSPPPDIPNGNYTGFVRVNTISRDKYLEKGMPWEL
ncbi:hypothetical protein COU57_06195 [Candidatus Pacearchaeota archaeon CG10_big_fil_rev_8_21_14_0_10_32_14]|nr:MAG: hypothetical protein COU57_06195 [Candidatus Pacearchaeota archaeon CG10_big_fil_rev_8_21_14_0_10_32_14]